MRRIIYVLAGVFSFALGLTAFAGAGPGHVDARFDSGLDKAKKAAVSQSGSPSPLVADNFTVLGHANLGGGVPNGDVWFHNHGGYVGDRKGSSNEDVVVRRIGNRDVLGIGVQACGAGGSNGLALFDVTNPRSPSQLSFFATPGGVHELDLIVQPNGTALALLA